jgi:hypothetical protein
MTGPFTETPVLCSSRYSVVSKSPLTGIFGESNSGGSWAEMLKKSGFDGIVIKGLNDSIKELSKGIVEQTLGLKKLGTAGALAVFEEMGSLPLQNWKYVGCNGNL